MTGKTDFTEEEWQLVLKGPPSAGMIVVTAQRGGTFRETIAIGKAYVEARQQHGESELLDEIVELLASLASGGKQTVIIVTHDVGVAKRAPRVVRMRDGQLLQA